MKPLFTITLKINNLVAEISKLFSKNYLKSKRVPIFLKKVARLI